MSKGKTHKIDSGVQELRNSSFFQVHNFRDMGLPEDISRKGIEINKQGIGMLFLGMALSINSIKSYGN